MPDLEIRAVQSPINGVGYYSKADFYVLFEAVPKQKAKFVYHIDTLTMCMDNNMHLVSLDAYTYDEKWQRVNLAAPEVHSQGNIQLIADYDENRIAGNRNVKLEYDYDVEKGILRISISQSDTVPEETIQVGENLLVQIGPNQELVSIWFLDLQIQ